MKKLIALWVFALLIAGNSYSQTTNQNLTQAVTNAQSEQYKAYQQESSKRSTDAHDKAVYDMVLRVESQFTTTDYPQTYDKPCSAVLIDKHWLLASLSCRGVGDYANASDHNGNKWLKEVLYRHIIKASIKAHALNSRDVIWPRDIFVDEQTQIILLYIDPTNENLQDELNDKNSIVANLFIPTDPKKVTEAVTEAYINRENYCLPGRCSDGVTVKQYCDSDKCYKVQWELIDGDAGDPLILVSHKLKRAEFVMGFNNAVIDGSSTSSGRRYHALDRQALAAIQRIVSAHDPQAWERIKTYVADETQI